METTSTDKRLDHLSDRLGRFEVSVDGRFDQVDRKFDKVDERFDKVDERFDKVDERFEKVDERFDKVDERFEKVDERFDKVDDRFVTKAQFEMAASETKERFGRVEASIAGLGEQLDRMNRTITGSFLTIVAAVIIKLFVA
jgi:hypothetical protein